MLKNHPLWAREVQVPSNPSSSYSKVIVHGIHNVKQCIVGYRDESEMNVLEEDDKC